MSPPRFLALPLLTLLCLSGCGDGPTRSGAAGATTATASSSAAAAAAPTSSGPVPLPASDVAWLAKLSALPPQLDKAVDLTSDPKLTVRRMARIADTMRECRRGLTRFGRPSTRLGPVLEIAQQACAEYDAAAVCFANASKIGIPLEGSSADRRQTAAIQCGFENAAEGAPLLASAVTLGDGIEAGTV